MESGFTSTYVELDFKNEYNERLKRAFTNPVEIVSVKGLQDVRPALRRIQEAVKQGYFAVGYVSYEAAPAFDRSYKVNGAAVMPLLWFGIYEGYTIVETEGAGDDFRISSWKHTQSEDTYHASIGGIHEAIARGETYQVNYTTRLRAQFQGDEYALYKELCAAQQGDYNAFLRIDGHSVLSASPELFFCKKGNQILTRPMKGTVGRGLWLEDDKRQGEWLKASAKNQAENVMITDLLRNDLGMIAKTGTVSVPNLFDIEKYYTLYQMTSTITAEIEEDTDLEAIFSALFPCGSITGAPKVSTMGIIAELEDTPREVYCGAIGIVEPDGSSLFSVAIRTVRIDHASNVAEYGVGGGITWDSTAENEYAEVLTKALLLTERSPDFKLLESLKLEDGEYFLVDEHLHRLADSAQYFDYSFSREQVVKELQNLALRHPLGVHKVRLLVSRDGDIVTETSPLPEMTPCQHGKNREAAARTVVLAKTPVSRNDRFLYHKTTHRQVYEKHKQEAASDVFDVLLWNEDGELTEFTTGNLVVEIDGELLTPALGSGLLAGTYRNYLLSTNVIKESVLKVTDISRATQLWYINSVRKWIKIIINAGGEQDAGSSTIGLEFF
ncbi:aminodeoxychorismate synthase, subunit I /aminodeoxychorismate lyase apoprotein [Fontibacillus panacisegetis]|uniref:Aminodeoxychorismate synthase, subunit I /aminodeoxychorismate lyase apoprotein n=1 Tax=Fontibacillus panacisegetis TaxID=670482 RepID=A0A1G7R9S9_9BACL|nr:aminodeoxychorismate synthase component I [Fontibacillus panacisegetis]SDG06740.1 aminodeoxychorismate synthase, subunit I /aminodeoxychorismate lyase apoprotein [Fontibacillus panacisegetis]